jgi:predicted component of type VI protein secretion system
MSLNAKLVVVGGDVKTTEIKLRLPSTIGRGKGTTIVLQHPLVSRQHCEIFETDGQLMVRDLGSLNGTFVNNQRVTEAPLPAGELLTVGTVTFRAIYESASGQAAAKPGKAALAATKVEPKRASSAPKPKPAAAATEVEELDFEFDKPLMSDDDDLGETAHPTEALEGDVEHAKAAQERTRGGAPAKPPGKLAKPPSKPGKPAPLAATKTEDATVDFSSLDEDDDETAASSDSDDEDLNDFLKTLEDK